MEIVFFLLFLAISWTKNKFRYSLRFCILASHNDNAIRFFRSSKCNKSLSKFVAKAHHNIDDLLLVSFFLLLLLVRSKKWHFDFVLVDFFITTVFVCISDAACLQWNDKIYTTNKTYNWIIDEKQSTQFVYCTFFSLSNSMDNIMKFFFFSLNNEMDTYGGYCDTKVESKDFIVICTPWQAIKVQQLTPDAIQNLSNKKKTVSKGIVQRA